METIEIILQIHIDLNTSEMEFFLVDLMKTMKKRTLYALFIYSRSYDTFLNHQAWERKFAGVLHSSC